MNPFWLYLTLGVGLLAIELLVFQFTTFWLFFIGVGALVAAAFAWLVVDASYIATTAVFLVASVAVIAVLYKPLRNWQQKPSGIADNNAIGQKVKVKRDISAERGGIVSWSGSNWQAELAEGQHESLQAGDTAYVKSVEGIKLYVSKG